MVLWINLVLITVLIICVVTDLKSRRIYNKVIFPSLLFALLANVLINGWSGLTSTLVGFLLGLAILFIPFYFGGMGAGDVKLLALIGALKGTSFVFDTAIYMALFGAVIALAILLFQRGFAKKILYYLYGRKCGVSMPVLFEKNSLTATYPYGVAIALGAITALTLQELTFL